MLCTPFVKGVFPLLKSDYVHLPMNWQKQIKDLDSVLPKRELADIGSKVSWIDGLN